MLTLIICWMLLGIWSILGMIASDIHRKGVDEAMLEIANDFVPFVFVMVLALLTGPTFVFIVSYMTMNRD